MALNHPDQCPHAAAIVDAWVGAPGAELPWEQDPNWQELDLSGIGMYASIGRCPDCGNTLVVRVASGPHPFGDNEYSEIRTTRWVPLLRPEEPKW